MNTDNEKLSRVIGTIYDASLDANLWWRVLEDVAGFVGASCATMGSYTAESGSLVLQLSYGYEKYWMDLYEQKYLAMNPFIERSSRQPVGEVASLSGAGLLHEMDGTQMKVEWSDPQGIVDVAEVILDRTLTSAAAFSLVRKTRDGLFDPEAEQQLQLLFPHLRRSLIISRVLKMHRDGEESLSRVINRLAAGVCFVTFDGRITRCNDTADAMLSRNDPIKLRDGRLALRDGTADRSFMNALSRAKDLQSIGGRGVVIPLAGNDGTRFTVHLLPLRDRTTLGDISLSDGEVAVFLRATHVSLDSAMESMSRAYALTPAEHRIARGLLEIGNGPMIAEVFGISINTVRTHIRNIFAKAGVSRQSELVRLLQSFVSPFQS